MLPPCPGSCLAQHSNLALGHVPEMRIPAPLRCGEGKGHPEQCGRRWLHAHENQCPELRTPAPLRCGEGMAARSRQSKRVGGARVLLCFRRHLVAPAEGDDVLRRGDGGCHAADVVAALEGGGHSRRHRGPLTRSPTACSKEGREKGQGGAQC
jgi:hypothetical protein